MINLKRDYFLKCKILEIGKSEMEIHSSKIGERKLSYQFLRFWLNAYTIYGSNVENFVVNCSGVGYKILKFGEITFPFCLHLRVCAAPKYFTGFLSLFSFFFLLF